MSQKYVLFTREVAQIFSVMRLAIVIVREELFKLGDLVLTVHLSQQAVQHEGYVLLDIYSLDHFDSVLKSGDGYFNVLAFVIVAAVDLAKLLQDEARTAL